MLKTLILSFILLLKPFGSLFEKHIAKNPNSKLQTGWYYITDVKNSYQRQLYKSDESYYVDPTPIVPIKHFKKLEVSEETFKGKPHRYIVIWFDDIGTTAWATATAKAIYKNLALIIDDHLVCAPKVYSQITGGVSTLDLGVNESVEISKFESVLKSEMIRDK